MMAFTGEISTWAHIISIIPGAIEELKKNYFEMSLKMANR